MERKVLVSLPDVMRKEGQRKEEETHAFTEIASKQEDAADMRDIGKRQNTQRDNQIVSN